MGHFFMKPEKSLFVRLSLDEHARLKAYANAQHVTMSDLIRATVLEKMNQDHGSDAQLFALLDKIKSVVERSALVSESALIAACRYQIGSAEDLPGIGLRRTQAIAAAKNWMTKDI